MLELVRTYGEAVPSLGKNIERGLKSWKRTRAIGNVSGIMLNKIGEHSFDFVGYHGAPLGLKSSDNHGFDSAADQLACTLVRDGGQAFALEYDIERVDEVGRCIHQCSVEVKNEQRR